MNEIDEPISEWIDELRQGENDAATHLWNHFVARLYDLARKKLRNSSRPVYDEEDAALSAFHSVCAGIVDGRFPDLNDRDSLWRLILRIMVQKIANRHRHDQLQCRDVRRKLSDAISTAAECFVSDQACVVSYERTPEFDAEFAETWDRLFQDLDSSLAETAQLRMEGYNDSEIAENLNCSRRTVQRRVAVIRRHWIRLEQGCE